MSKGEQAIVGYPATSIMLGVAIGVALRKAGKISSNQALFILLAAVTVGFAYFLPLGLAKFIATLWQVPTIAMAIASR